MAMLAPRSSYAPPHGLSSQRQQAMSGGARPASPTNSDFSDAYENDVKSWDESRVADWLRTIGAEKYVPAFRDNNITGENLMDIDSDMLKDIGVEKVGDRVRIGSHAKQFRTRNFQRRQGKNRVRKAMSASKKWVSDKFAKDSFALLENSGRASPVITQHPARQSKLATGGASKGRGYDSAHSSRPNSPRITEEGARIPRKPLNVGGRRYNRPDIICFIDSDDRPNYYLPLSPDPCSPSIPQHRPNLQPRTQPKQKSKPMTLEETLRRIDEECGPDMLSQTLGKSPGEVARGFARPPPPSSDAGQVVRYTDENAGYTNSSSLPIEMPLVRVIFDNGTASVVNVEGVKTCDDIIRRSLRKSGQPESLFTTYCFWVLDGTDANPVYVRKIAKDEVLRLCLDRTRPERERLILRKIHAGEPEMPQLQASARLAQSQKAQSSNMTKSHLKVQKILGDKNVHLTPGPLPSIAYPMSPNSAAERERHLNSAAMDLERSASKIQQPPSRRRKMKEWNGGRPPSELIVADTATYFPEATKGEIERLTRMSIRRSQRLSRATSRLSVASTASSLSGMRTDEDVPPIPSIADNFLKDGAVRARPLSILRLGRPSSTYRQSITPSVLEPLDEEESLEPDRKSYVSFSESPEFRRLQDLMANDPISPASQSEFEDGSPTLTEAGSSLNEQLRQAIAEDGEPPDEELDMFLKDDTYENIRYIRGKLIGQGSFGSVYLALHAFTAELMAVKQVELPTSQNSAIDAKRENMVEALKREIALLRELKHPHIVQYLGSGSEANTLNIFLEYIPGGSIAKMLIDFGSLSEDIVSKFVRQILIGLAYLHSKDIIHRDIKGANILVDNHGQVKISDFGISKRVQDSKNLLENPDAGSGDGAPKPKGRGAFANNRVSLQGSVFWMAPEVVKQTAHTRKADIWSLGCLVVEMLTGSHPHPNCTQLQAIFKIGGKGIGGVDPSPEMPEKAGAAARDFLKSTFKLEHQERPEAEELLSYSFVKARQLAP